MLRRRRRRGAPGDVDVPGVARAFVDRDGQLPQLLIEIDRARAARYGLNVADVEDVIETALGGKAATDLWEGERASASSCGSRRKSAATRRRSANVLVDTPTGSAMPLSEVATVTVGSGSMNIARENGRRVVAIGVFIRGRDMGSVVKDMQARVRDDVPLADGLYVTLVGRVREPGARDGALARDRADLDPADLHPAVRCVRIGQAARC